MGATEEERLYQLVITPEEADLLQVLVKFAKAMTFVVEENPQFFARMKDVVTAYSIERLMKAINDMVLDDEYQRAGTRLGNGVGDTRLYGKILKLTGALLADQDEEEEPR